MNSSSIQLPAPPLASSDSSFLLDPPYYCAYSDGNEEFQPLNTKLTTPLIGSIAIPTDNTNNDYCCSE